MSPRIVSKQSAEAYIRWLWGPDRHGLSSESLVEWWNGRDRILEERLERRGITSDGVPRTCIDLDASLVIARAEEYAEACARRNLEAAAAPTIGAAP